jgi:hypothetical protein
MVSRLLVAEHRSGLEAITTLAQRDLLSVWRSLDISDAREATDVLLVEIPTLTTAYGELAATLSADIYDEMRSGARVAGRSFRAVPAPPVPLGQAQALARWGVSPIWSDAPDAAAALSKLSGGLTRLTLEPARETMLTATRTDPAKPRWGRVTSGNACEFCEMLAGRGFVYAEDTSEFQAHDNCKCSAVPAFG